MFILSCLPFIALFATFLGTSSYYFWGYHPVQILYIIFSLLLLIYYLSIQESPRLQIPRVRLLDFILPSLLVCIFLVPYLYLNYQFPVQVNTDEAAIISTTKQIMAEKNPDLFGLSNYFGFPNFSFIIIGQITQHMGGVNLGAVRMVHSIVGILSIILAYIFFRQGLSPYLAFIAASILGSNHALIAISRMAMRDNFALFVEIIFLIFCSLVLRFYSKVAAILSGALIGLSFYVYYPARITLPIFGIVMFILFIRHLRYKQLQLFIKLIVLSLLGFFIVASPLFISTIKRPTDTFAYQKKQLLLFPEGRALQKNWLYAQNTSSALKENALNGMTMFLLPLYDQGSIYPNYGFGFFDGFAGILSLLGLLLVVIYVLKKKKQIALPLLCGIGFFTIWIVSAFLLTKNPNYTRLLVILPFSAYLAVFTIQTMSTKLLTYTTLKSSHAKLFKIGVFSVCLLIIGFLNGRTLVTFFQKGQDEGHSVGATARYIEANSLSKNYTYYLSADNHHPFFYWGDQSLWKGWIEAFTQPGTSVVVLSPQQIIDESLTNPFTLFLPNSLWIQHQATLTEKYPQLRVVSLMPDDSRVAIEVTQ